MLTFAIPRGIPVPIAGRSLVIAIILAFSLSNGTEAATRPSSALDPDTIVVEASGDVPGLTPKELTAYLAGRLQEETPDPSHFSPGKPGAVHAPNRVVWAFKVLRRVWKGGSHRGFQSPSNWVFYLSAEVKLYLRDTYQTTMITQPSVSGTPDDQVLSEMVHDVAQAMFVENKPNVP